MPNNTPKPPNPWLFCEGGLPRVLCSQHSCRRSESLADYAPVVSEGTRGLPRRKQFDVAIGKLQKMIDEPWTPEVLSLLNESDAYQALKEDIDSARGRLRNCSQCRDTHKRSRNNPETIKGAVRETFKEIQSMASTCVDCGRPNTTECPLDNDHVKGVQDKRAKMCDFAFWEKFGTTAPEEMWIEFSKCAKRCVVCHRHQPTNHGHGAARNRPASKWIDDMKMLIGGCMECKLPIVASLAEWEPGKNGIPRAFEFAHISETCKRVVNGKRMTMSAWQYLYDDLQLDDVVPEKGTTLRELLEFECELCRLLCGNCHRIETKTRGAVPGEVDEELQEAWKVQCKAVASAKRARRAAKA